MKMCISIYFTLKVKYNDASIKLIKSFQVNLNDGIGTVFTLGKPICGYDNIQYDYISFIVIQSHRDNGYMIKLISCSQKVSTSSNKYHDLFNFMMISGNASIWYI